MELIDEPESKLPDIYFMIGTTTKIYIKENDPTNEISNVIKGLKSKNIYQIMYFIIAHLKHCH